MRVWSKTLLEQERATPMAEITLKAKAGRACGSAVSRRLRAQGRIPAVVYGHGVSGLAVSVEARELRHALSGGAGLNQLLSLDIDGERHLVMAREVQRHPVRHNVVHLDFQVVRRDEVISAEVPISLVGEAKAVEQEKGVIEQPLQTLTIKAVPGAIPESIEVDVSGLAVGEAIRVADLRLPAGVSTDLPGDEPVVVAGSTRAGAPSESEEGPEDGASEEG